MALAATANRQSPAVADAPDPHRRPPRGDLPPPSHTDRSRPAPAPLAPTSAASSPTAPSSAGFRAIHPPPPLGFLPNEEAGFLPAQPPHPSAPLARALADAADFSYSFVPTGRWLTPWRTRDVRQGRVLIECCPEDALDHPSLAMRQVDLVLAVCDPLYRRYVLLPTIPADPADKPLCYYDFGLFLVPTSEDEEETSFRVMCTVSNDTNLVAFLYSSVTGHWCIVASLSWSSLGTVPPRGVGLFSSFEYSQGCFFWTAPWREKLLVLDTLRMEFSIVRNVPYSYCKLDTGQPCIVMDTEGSPEMLLLSNSFDLLHFHVTKQIGNVPSDRWQLQNVIPLPSKYYYYLTLGAAEGFLFLRCIPETQRLAHSSEDLVDDYCLLDIKTSDLKKFLT
ncbi:hypothetical protein PR202_gb21220 [Eleusine coracana subsp. coracana]|uniref:DUF1618 domain-containing protein n=1 Tax=Eleusine coracana subsp. coracana TaxID=191504 RepID=A0AAV5FAL2_ELECO|nr:hypothetical protein PR202_gb21220 [Eleusine coracana subsp. coracana]